MPIAWDTASLREEVPAHLIETQRWPIYLANGARYPESEVVYPCRSLSGRV